MFRPNVGIIRFSSESMVVVLYQSCKALPPYFLDIVVLLTEPLYLLNRRLGGVHSLSGCFA